MTDYLIRNQDYLLNQITQMTNEFNEAQREIRNAESEASFAQYKAVCAQVNAEELEFEIYKWNNILSSPFTLVQSLIAAKYEFLNSSETFKYSKRLKVRDHKVKVEVFKHLKSCTDNLQTNLDKINTELATTTNPDDTEDLLKAKEKLEGYIEKSNQIQQIDNDKEAMRAFKNLTKEMFIDYCPDKTLTTEQKQALLAKADVGEDEVNDSFHSILNVWSLFKDSSITAEEKLNKKAPVFVDDDSAVNATFSPLAESSAIDVSSDTESGELTINKQNLLDQQTQYDSDIDKLQDVSTYIKENNVCQEIAQTVFNIDYINKEFDEKYINKNSQINDVHKPINFVLEDLKNTSKETIKKKNDYKKLSNNNEHSVYNLSNEIENSKQALSKLQCSEENKNHEIKLNIDFINDNDDKSCNSIGKLINKIEELAANTENNETKIVIDKSLFSLKDILNPIYGDRVVVNNRNSDRRQDNKRRSDNVSTDASLFNENRENSDARRKADRRSTNQIFIFGETINDF